MKKVFLSFCFLLSTYAFSANLHYSLIKKESGKEGSTLLIVGGIHGDEPGGYFAPMLLARYYKIEVVISGLFQTSILTALSKTLVVLMVT